MKRPQFCDNCGEPLGEFDHNRRADGPLSCGERECNRAARDEEMAETEEAQDRAARDGWERYR